jgi:hypothetical protein
MKSEEARHELQSQCARLKARSSELEKEVAGLKTVTRSYVAEVGGSSSWSWCTDPEKPLCWSPAHGTSLTGATPSCASGSILHPVCCLVCAQEQMGAGEAAGSTASSVTPSKGKEALISHLESSLRAAQDRVGPPNVPLTLHSSCRSSC